MFLVILAAMTLLAVALVAAPLVRRRKPVRSRSGLEIYRDQLAELDSERARGLIPAEEADAARREIERRLLRALDCAEKVEQKQEVPPRNWRQIAAIGLLIVAIPLTAGLIYARLGSAGAIGALPWQPSAEQQEAAEFNELLHTLERKVLSEPDRQEGWILLGRMYGMSHRFNDAAKAFERAASLGSDDPNLLVEAAENRVFAQDGKVTPDVRGLINRALARDPHNPGALYYRGLGEWQDGRQRAAYDIWLALARAAPPDAPWLPALAQRLRDAAATLKIPAPEIAKAGSGPAGPNAAEMEQASRMSPEQRTAMIRGMVDSLAARLKDNPNDLAGWMRLGRSYSVLGAPEKSLDAYEHAGALAPDDPDTLIPLGEARAQAGRRDGALQAFERARDKLAPRDPRREQVESEIRALQGAEPSGR